MIEYPVYKPSLDGNEKKYVCDCIDSTWISSKGKYVDLFERKFAEFIGGEYAVSVSNGTVALHLALLALEIKSGDEVIVPTFTYVASVNAISYVGATPVFVDSDVNTWQIDVADVERKITSRTKAVIAVPLYGAPCDMNALLALKEKYGFFLIEDCAEAIGSRFEDRYVGSFGDIATFSFFGNKTITTGEGGMVVTNCKEYDTIVRRYKGQGVSAEREYWHDLIGYNYRMTNICAAIGLAQLEQIKEIIDQKIHVADTYKKLLTGLPLKFHTGTGNSLHTYWMCSILLDTPEICLKLRLHLKERGVETRPLFPPVHIMPIYRGAPGDFPVAEFLSERGMNLPSYPALSDSDLKHITMLINSFFNE